MDDEEFFGYINTPTVILIHGYIGFGKTTIAKKLQRLLGYKRFTHDEYMSKMFGDHPTNEEFEASYNKATEVILKKVEKELQNGRSVILDFGFWTKKSREEICSIIDSFTFAYEVGNKHLELKNSIPTVLWVNVQCDINVARQRCIERDKNRKPGQLWVPVEVFDMKLNQFEPMNEHEFPFNRLNIKPSK